MALASKQLQETMATFRIPLTISRYHGTSDLQLERMNVYFNEVV